MKEDYKLLKEGTFSDNAYWFFKGLVVKCEKMGDAYMITINEGRTWTNIYESEEASMEIFNRMTKEEARVNEK